MLESLYSSDPEFFRYLLCFLFWRRN